VLEVWLDLGELEDYPSNKMPGFNDRLTAWLPALIEHHCGVGERGGFQRLREGTWAGHILEHVVIELLNLAGMPTGFGQTRRPSAASTAWCSAPARSAWRAALDEGHDLLMAAINDEPSTSRPPSTACAPRSTTATWAPAPPASSTPPPSAASRTSA
jgi:cyanophycin synthetase